MKKPAVLLASLLFSAGAIAAETKRQLAEHYLVATDAEKGYERNIDSSYYAAVKPMMQKLTAEQRVKADRANQRVIALMHAEMGWAKMKPHMLEAVLATYTEDELKAAIAFNESPAGKSFTAKAPAFTQSTMKTGMEMGATLQPKIRQIMQEELSAKEAPAAAPATPATPAK